MAEICAENILRLNKEDRKIALAFTLIAITSTLAIIHTDTTIPEGRFSWLPRSIMAVSLLYIFLKTVRKHIKTQAIALLTIFLFWYFITTFYTYASYKADLNLTTILSLILFCLHSKRVWAISFEMYYKYITISALLGIIAVVLYFVPIGFPKTVCPYYIKILGNYEYHDFYFAYIVVEGAYVRLCGLFNEPGYFGTFLGLFLIANNIDLKRKSNRILLIAGVFTFSAAFFITIILFYVIKMSFMKDFKALIILVILVIIANLDFGNNNVTRLLERLSFSGGKLNAVNRTTMSLDVFFDDYITSSRAFFGYGRGFLSSSGEVGSLSYKTYIIEYGLVACCIFWGGLFVNAIKYSKKVHLAIIYSILFMINIYQRPGIFTFGYMLLLFGGVCYISLYKGKKTIDI